MSHQKKDNPFGKFSDQVDYKPSGKKKKNASAVCPEMEAFIKNTAPVVITKEEIEKSENIRSQRPKSVRQLPVFRDVKNLMYISQQLAMRMPHKAHHVIDELTSIESQLLLDVVMANENKDFRAEYCTEAYARLEVIYQLCGIIHAMGFMSRDDANKVSALIERSQSQVVAWRSFTVASVTQGNGLGGTHTNSCMS